MSFVTFTSFSTGYGLTSNTYNAGISPEGLLVRRPVRAVISTTVTFVPLETATITWLQNKPDILLVAPKFENAPTFFPEATISPSTNPSKAFDVFGVLGIQPGAEANITHIDDLVTGGSYITDLNQNEIMITRQAAESLSINVGDELLLDTGVLEARFTLVGILDDVGFSQMRDIDLTPLLPQKIVETTSAPGSPPTIVVERCRAAEVIVMNYEAAQEVFGAISLSRIDVKLQSPNSAGSLSRQIALERDLSVWYSFAGTVNQVGLGGYTEAKGLSVMIPWIIVMVNVIITMLNSMFERRKEIGILSSVGLNPSHIGGIFMAEAAIIGIVGGGVGYLLGLGSYRGLILLSVLVEVREKVSAIWSFASLGVAIVAVLVGTGIALRSSVIITPSALRKWTGESNVVEKDGRLEFRMPIRLHEDGVEALFSYLKEAIPNHIVVAYPTVDVDSVKRRATETQELDNDINTRTLFFNYFFGQADFIGSSPFSLVALKQRGEDTYSLTLICSNADKEAIERKVTFIRMKIVDWDSQRK
jgi:ABC-type lipoprotein release transport system permease subunit